MHQLLFVLALGDFIETYRSFYTISNTHCQILSKCFELDNVTIFFCIFFFIFLIAFYNKNISVNVVPVMLPSDNQ
ncbi:hypothetical protein CW304_06325 [Bacillus sp. UFRGS-B20]|nr:hypothetical protein CW304_06325 [Bacillus sp. UFRGS-B20]